MVLIEEGVLMHIFMVIVAGWALGGAGHYLWNNIAEEVRDKPSPCILIDGLTFTCLVIMWLYFVFAGIKC
jgi:hypothetical protein